MIFSTAFHATKLSFGHTCCKDLPDSFTMRMQICKQPLSHATVLEGTHAADLKGTDAKSTSLRSLDVLLRHLCPSGLLHVCLPELLHGPNSKVGSPVRPASASRYADKLDQQNRKLTLLYPPS